MLVKIRIVISNLWFFVKRMTRVLPKAQGDFIESAQVDIAFRGQFPANVLSNLYPSRFIFEGVKCGSMEGFLQSLKTPDKTLQKKICKMSGIKAKRMSDKFRAKFDSKTIYWKEKPIDRFSQEYDELVKRAFQTKFEQDPLFRHALKQTQGKKLIHTLGKSNKEKTILTEEEFVNLLGSLVILTKLPGRR
jgi:hypothetical protein